MLGPPRSTNTPQICEVFPSIFKNIIENGGVIYSEQKNSGYNFKTRNMKGKSEMIPRKITMEKSNENKL